MIAIAQYADIFSGSLVAAACVLLYILSMQLILGPVYRSSRSMRRQAPAAIRKEALPVERFMVDNLRPISWAQSLCAGVGFLLTGSAMVVIWLIARMAAGVRSYELDFLLVPIVLLCCGVIYLTRGILHRYDQKASQLATLRAH